MDGDELMEAIRDAARNVEKTLEFHVEYSPENGPLREMVNEWLVPVIGGFLADVRHFADAAGIDHATVIKQSEVLYRKELSRS